MVPRLQHLALNSVATPDDIAHALIDHAGNPHRYELPGGVEARQTGEWPASLASACYSLSPTYRE